MEWHKISDGLPPIGVPLIVTVKDNLGHKQNKVLYPAYYERKRENNGYHFTWRYGDMAYELLPDVSEVIAWLELPKPYESEGGIVRVVHCLSSLPVNDGNFKSAMNRASDEDIKSAIDIMKMNGGSHKGRILACERELRKRGKNR